MIFNQTPIPGAFVIEPERREDDRGYFARVYCEREFSEHGLSTKLVQANVALSRDAGTTRGLHYQHEPNAEAKLVRCTSGRVFDVIVDVRKETSSYLQWFGVELDAASNRQLYVPEGCAHGYQVLEPDSELHYLVSAFYAPDSEAGLRWDDPAIGIQWPIKDNLLLSEKDRQWSLLG